MITGAFEAKRPLGLLLPILLIVLIGATLVFHDYFCHDHLHELYSPLHSFYDNPAPYEAESYLGNPLLEPVLFIQDENIHLDEFIKNIFHPPDRLS
jgi:hypothetical protein